LLGGFVLLSLGLAFLFTPLFSVSLGSLKPHLYSYGSATVATLQQVAGAAGVAIFVALYATGLASAGNVDPNHPSAAEAASGAHLAFLAGGFISFAVIVLTLFVRKLETPAMAEGEWAGAEAH
ncbi:MAG: MFS transporter, partial [Pseudolysinimonas sp.]